LVSRLLRQSGSESDARRREFEKLARAHYRDVYRAAYRLAGDPDEAADLAQEALVKAYVSFEQFESGTNFRAWMMRIVATTHISRYRYRRRRPEVVPWDAVIDSTGRETAAVAETAPGPEAVTVGQFNDVEIEQALASLPEEFRVVAIMSDLYGMQYKDIASALGVPLGTVRSRLFRARRLLRRSLEDYARERGLLRGEYDD
jgi:RNA polymerase sigma-70 factor (ECF subfamily)